MKPLPQEIELQKILDCIKESFPLFNIPSLYMFHFSEDYNVYGRANKIEEIWLSMPTIGEFVCENEQFVNTVVHEVTHLNCWDSGHDENFQKLNNEVFDKVWRTLNETKQSIKKTT